MKCGSGRYGWLPVPMATSKIDAAGLGCLRALGDVAVPVCQVNFQKYQRELLKLSCDARAVARHAVAGDDAVGHRPGRAVVARRAARR